jgi:hypothetical protein
MEWEQSCTEAAEARVEELEHVLERLSYGYGYGSSHFKRRQIQMQTRATSSLPTATMIAATDPSHLELCIRTDNVGLYPQPPINITSDQLAYSAMTTSPPNPTSPSNFTCLLSGPLDDFLLYSGQEQSQWLIDIAHDVCDPAQKRGSLQVWDAAGEMWRNVHPTDPLTASAYLYNVQAVVSLSKSVNVQANLKPVPVAMLPQWQSVSSSEMDDAGCPGLPRQSQTVMRAPSEWETTSCVLFTAALCQLLLLPLYPSMMKYVASPSVGPLMPHLTRMNLVCGLSPRCEVHIFLTYTVNH